MEQPLHNIRTSYATNFAQNNLREKQNYAKGFAQKAKLPKVLNAKTKSLQKMFIIEFT